MGLRVPPGSRTTCFVTGSAGRLGALRHMLASALPETQCWGLLLGCRAGHAAACTAGGLVEFDSLRESVQLSLQPCQFATCVDVLGIWRCRQVHTGASHVTRRRRRRDRGALDHQQRRQRAGFSQGEPFVSRSQRVQTRQKQVNPVCQLRPEVELPLAETEKLHMRRVVGKPMRRWRQQRQGKLWRRLGCEGRWRCAARS